MDHELYVLMWIDDDGPQAAIYEDIEEAERDAELVGGRIELRVVHPSAVRRAGRFERPQG